MGLTMASTFVLTLYLLSITTDPHKCFVTMEGGELDTPSYHARTTGPAMTNS